MTLGADQAIPGPITSSPRVGPGRRGLQLLYDVAIGLVWAVMLPLFLLAGVLKPRLARKALSLSTVGLTRLSPTGSGRKRVLVHGVSVGEIKASQSLVHALQERYEVVVSAFSDTGMQVARQLFPEIEVVRYPFDFAPIVTRFWRLVCPDFVLLVELEAWPCFLRAANRRGAPVAVVSGRITEQSFRRYQLFGALPEFGRISLFAAQDEAYAARFAALAGSSARVLVTGNVKVDGLRGAGDSDSDGRLQRLREEVGVEGVTPAPFVIVAGSTHEPEEEAFVAAARGALPDARLILVPRHPERAEAVQEALSRGGVPDHAPERLSELRAQGRRADPSRPLLVDTIGELEELYGVADAVFIGGSLIPHGGQNMMEPAAQGVPVVYGPHVDNFLNETQMLEAAGAALRVLDAASLGDALGTLAGDPGMRRRMGEAGRKALRAERGATVATLEALSARIGLA